MSSSMESLCIARNLEEGIVWRGYRYVVSMYPVQFSAGNPVGLFAELQREITERYGTVLSILYTRVGIKALPLSLHTTMPKNSKNIQQQKTMSKC